MNHSHITITLPLLHHHHDCSCVCHIKCLRYLSLASGTLCQVIVYSLEVEIILGKYAYACHCLSYNLPPRTVIILAFDLST